MRDLWDKFIEAGNEVHRIFIAFRVLFWIAFGLILIASLIVYDRGQQDFSSIPPIAFVKDTWEGATDSIMPTPAITRPPPTVSPVPTNTPRPAPTPTPTPALTLQSQKEIREILQSLRKQAQETVGIYNQDAKLRKIVDDGLLFGQYDIAFWAATDGGIVSTRSAMISDVVYCVAYEEEFVLARLIASTISDPDVQQKVLDDIFHLEHRKLRSIALPPVCRKTDWLRLPNFS